MKTKAIINRTNKTITVSHSFLVAAGNIHSAEYQEYVKMKETYPNFTFTVQQKSRGKSDSIFGDLSYQGMSSFIQGYERSEESIKAALKELEDLRALYAGSRGAYLKVKEWFLDKYKEEFDRRKAEKKAEDRKKREASFLYHPANA